jgi:hypothetical protein
MAWQLLNFGLGETGQNCPVKSFVALGYEIKGDEFVGQ